MAINIVIAVGAGVIYSMADITPTCQMGIWEACIVARTELAAQFKTASKVTMQH